VTHPINGRPHRNEEAHFSRTRRRSSPISATCRNTPPTQTPAVITEIKSLAGWWFWAFRCRRELSDAVVEFGEAKCSVRVRWVDGLDELAALSPAEVEAERDVLPGKVAADVDSAQVRTKVWRSAGFRDQPLSPS